MSSLLDGTWLRKEYLSLRVSHRKFENREAKRKNTQQNIIECLRTMEYYERYNIHMHIM